MGWKREAGCGKFLCQWSIPSGSMVNFYYLNSLAEQNSPFTSIIRTSELQRRKACPEPEHFAERLRVFKAQLISDLCYHQIGSDEFFPGFFNELAADILPGVLPDQRAAVLPFCRSREPVYTVYPFSIRALLVWKLTPVFAPDTSATLFLWFCIILSDFKI